MRKGYELDLLFVDVETDGSDVNVNEIVQIGALRVDRNTLEPFDDGFESLIYASLDNASRGAMQVHGIAADDIWEADSASMVFSNMLDYMDPREVLLCGWNITMFDVPIIKRQWKEAKFPWKFYHMLDMYSAFVWMCSVCEIEVDSYSLDSACELFGIKGRKKRGFHGALEDCRLSLGVMKEMKGLIE